MITLPDLNEVLKPLNGSLFPFGWAKLLWWLRAPKVKTARVPLMGVIRRLQSSRLASQIAFMMIEYTRRAAVASYGASRGGIGRSEERRVGKECVSKWRSRGWPSPSKKENNKDRRHKERDI